MAKAKKIHLMHTFTPFSACGKYVGMPSPVTPMRQTFKIEETTCKNCLNQLGQYKINEEKNNKLETL